MSIAFSVARTTPANADAVVLGVFSDRQDSRPADLDWPALEARGFESKLAQVQVAEAGSNGSRGTLIAVAGLGNERELDTTGLRRVGAAVARALKKHATIAVPLLEDLPASIDAAAAVQAFVEGVVLGAYSFDRYKSDATPSAIRKVVLVGSGGRTWTQAATTASTIAEAVCWARDLVNEPGGTLTPNEFAKAAVAMAKRRG